MQEIQFSSGIKEFQYNTENSIRVLESESQVLNQSTKQLRKEKWFVSKDICSILHITNPSILLSKVPENCKCKSNIGLCGRYTILLNTDGVSHLLFHVHNCNVNSFKKWFDSEFTDMKNNDVKHKNVEYIKPIISTTVLDNTSTITDISTIDDNNNTIQNPLNTDLIDFTKSGDVMVSGRVLYEQLKINSNYTTWFDRMCEYGFLENIDYKTCFPNLESEIHGGQNRVDHQITIDMAKQICMIQRTEKGKELRQCLINLEKDWNTPEKVMSRALQMANSSIQSLKDKVNSMQPLVDFAEHVTYSSNAISMDEFAKIISNDKIQIGRNELFKWLKDSGYLMTNNTPYQKYINNGMFSVIEAVRCTDYGNKVFAKTLIQAKGQTLLLPKIRCDFGII